MMKLPKINSLVVTEICLVAFLLSPVALAQDDQSLQGRNISVEDGVPQEAAVETSDPGINPLWLLPLLILPALYILYRRFEQDNQEEDYISDAQYRPEVAYHSLRHKKRAS